MPRSSLAMVIILLGLLPACDATEPHAATSDAVAPLDTSASADAPATVTCSARVPQPRDAVWTLSVGGVTRTARVHVPASYDPAKRTPVVINVHGRTHSAAGQASVSRAIAKSDAAGFVVIHPEATGSPTSWNAGGGAGGGCCDPAYSSNVDDAGFIAKLVDEADAKLCLDTDRVYVMGLSNGGYLAHRVACELGDRIAAIGAVAGMLSLQSCAPTRPVPVFAVHGNSDQIVGYAGAQSSVNFWKATNGCTTTATTYQQGDASCLTHGGCTAGADVVLCTISGGGHQWPGGEALPFMGKKSDDLIATDALWDFFVAHPRTAAPP